MTGGVTRGDTEVVALVSPRVAESRRVPFLKCFWPGGQEGDGDGRGQGRSGSVAGWWQCHLPPAMGVPPQCQPSQGRGTALMSPRDASTGGQGICRGVPKVLGVPQGRGL